MLVARLAIKGSKIETGKIAPITSGMVGAEVEVSFDSAWDGFKKIFVWNHGNVTIDDLSASGKIPAEVLAKCGGMLMFGVYGTKDGTALPTLWTNIGAVNPGANPSGDESTDPALPVWAQLQVDVEALKAHGVTPEQLEEAVADYFKENPVEASGGVKTVNGIEPDENGNVKISIPDSSQNTNCVKKVASISPDQNGNIPMDWVATKTLQPLVILEETAVTPGYNKVLTYDMLEGQDELTVTFDGRLYICVPRFSYSEGDGYSVEFGNLALAGIDTADTGEPFYVWGYKGVKSMSFTFETSGEHAMSVAGSGFEYNPLPQEYLPQTVPVIQAAKAGQVVLIKAVDEKGVPTEWEAIDLPDGSQNGNDGEDGGYYTPVVTQVDQNTMKVSFSASKEGMAAAAAREITLPAGPAGRDGRDGQPGADGSPGADGLPGKDGQDGSDGITPHIGDNGNWFIGDTDTGIPSRGKAGADGKDGLDGKDGEPGKNGADGQPGKDGTSPVVSVSTITGGHRITITDANDTKYVDVMDGSNGKGGVDGAKGADGYTPVRGTDYWTPADQEDIVQQVIASLGTPVFGRVDDQKNITFTGELADGTYKLWFEDKDGKVSEICTYNHTYAPEPTYTNVLPLAINSDGTPYNGGQGWKNGYRTNSSGEEVAKSNCSVSGFIPALVSDLLYFANITTADADSNAHTNVALYDESFVFLGRITCSLLYDNKDVSQVSSEGVSFTEDGQLATCSPLALRYWLSKDVVEKTAYVRLTASAFTDNSIITVNEPIE